MSTSDVKEIVREKYGAAARAKSGGARWCCGDTAAVTVGCDPIASSRYDAAEADELPDLPLKASLVAASCCGPSCCH